MNEQDFLSFTVTELDMSVLSDEEVLALSHLDMDPEQNTRLEYLLSKGKVAGVTEAEEKELSELMQISCHGRLHKSQGLAESVRRGLREPLYL